MEIGRIYRLSEARGSENLGPLFRLPAGGTYNCLQFLIPDTKGT